MLPDHRPYTPSAPSLSPSCRGTPVRGHRRRLLAVGVGAALVLLASACGGGGNSGTGGQAAQVAAGAADTASLRGICPATVVMQTNWFPQVEHASAYQLLGAGYTVNAGKKTVTGELIAHGGVDTGVKVEIRAGGPAIGNQQPSAQMYLDHSITLGMNATDETVQNALHQPTVAVFAPFEIDPLVLIWDPKAHPDFNTISDIGQTNTPVLYFQGESTYMDYLVGSGILRRSQVDGSYDGTPSRLVASTGQVVVQGFATSEPWKWQHEVPAWGKPLEYRLISDAGYPDYRDQWVVRTEDVHRLAPCLHKLVPIMQQALVDFMGDPKPTTATILSILSKYKTFYTDSEARSAHAVQVMKDDGLVGNGSNKTIGDFDMERVRTIIRIVTPIYTGQNKQVRADLRPEDIATNEFINPNIGLTRS
jgi:hypothetical protein